jgi:hypothetical protein
LTELRADVPLADAPPPKKPYEITWKTLDIKALQEEQKALVEEVAGLIDTDVSSTNSLPLFTH